MSCVLCIVLKLDLNRSDCKEDNRNIESVNRKIGGRPFVGRYIYEIIEINNIIVILRSFDATIAVNMVILVQIPYFPM